MSEELIADLDLALAALRRVIVRAIGASPAVVKPAEPRGPAAAPPAALSRPAKRYPTQPLRKPAGPVPPPAEANGVTVDFAELKVTYANASVHVTHRHAQLIATLARAMPNVMSRAEIVRRAWPDVSSASGNSMLSDRTGLAERLASIGLVLRVEVGIGFALQAKEG